jgi:hypothetical protein
VAGGSIKEEEEEDYLEAFHESFFLESPAEQNVVLEKNIIAI